MRTFSRFRWPTRKAFVLRTDAALAAPGLPNLWLCRNAGFRASKRCVGAAFRARGVCRTFPYFFSDFGGLLEKHLFLGRTLLLRLQGYQTCVGAGMLAPGLANDVLAQHFVLGVFAYSRISIRGQPSFPKGTLMSSPICFVKRTSSSKGTLASSPFRRLVGMHLVG